MCKFSEKNIPTRFGLMPEWTPKLNGLSKQNLQQFSNITSFKNNSEDTCLCRTSFSVKSAPDESCKNFISGKIRPESVMNKVITQIGRHAHLSKVYTLIGQRTRWIPETNTLDI